jgi:hypothetical protein
MSALVVDEHRSEYCRFVHKESTDIDLRLGLAPFTIACLFSLEKKNKAGSLRGPVHYVLPSATYKLCDSCSAEKFPRYH